jgi:hypothetical protein
VGALHHASVTLKNDKEVVLVAVQRDVGALHHASVTLKNDKEVVLAAVQQGGNALMFASGDLKNDKEVVLAAVQQDGNALEYASVTLKNDKEVVVAAVQQDGNALEYASDDLRNDGIFVSIAKLARIRHRFRWPRLVAHATLFARDDMAFKRKFHPDVLSLQVDAQFLRGGDEVGPQPTPFWTNIMAKRRKIGQSGSRTQQRR